MTATPVIVAARRTAVAPRGGAFRHLQADQLAAPVIEALLRDAGLGGGDVDQVIFGNALYGGGNPARMAMLRAGLPQTVPAVTVDSQCCSGLDAILQAMHLIRSGAARCVIAGGMESFSRAPIRMHRPLTLQDTPLAYDRPAFSPDPENDPDLTEAAAGLAEELGISRAAQAAYAVCSHGKARTAEKAGRFEPEFVEVPGALLKGDAFTRALTHAAALRAPVLAGCDETGLSAATIAVEADGAAAVLVVDRAFAEELSGRITSSPVSILQGLAIGGDPADAARVPIRALEDLLARQNSTPADIACLELMEAYAVQAMATCQAFDWPEDRINRSGGALARGHPVGASGAILAVRLFHELQGHRSGEIGLAAIAAAGGLASGIALSPL